MSNNNEMDEDKKEFMKELNKDLEVLVHNDALPQLAQKSDVREKVNIFYSAYYAKKLAEYTKWLVLATVVLASSAVLQLSNDWIGTEETMKSFILIVRQGITIILILAVVYAIASVAISGVRKIYKTLFKRNHKRIQSS